EIVAAEDGDGGAGTHHSSVQTAHDLADAGAGALGNLQVVPHVGVLEVKAARRRREGVAVLSDGEGDDLRLRTTDPLDYLVGLFGRDEGICVYCRDAGH